MRRRESATVAFSLVEVVLALGIVSFSVLATVGLLSVGNDTNKKARDESLAAQIVVNEFERIRSLSATNFPTTTYNPRFFDAQLSDVPSKDKAAAVYELRIALVTPEPSGSADMLLNAEVRLPANAPEANQTVFRYTTLMNIPK